MNSEGQHCFICNKATNKPIKVKQKAHGPMVWVCPYCKEGMDIVQYVTVETYLSGISGS